MDHGILIAGLLSLSTLISFGKAALGLGVVIFVHELGHFLVAKACGVKCEKFYVGFDAPITIFGISLPRTLFKKQWGETEYGIGIIPLGGYVKMLGQDDNPSNAAAEAERVKAEGGQLDPRSYPAKSVPQRMAIISAGVIFNIIFGIMIAAVAYKMGVKYTPTVIGGSGAGDPAWLAGMQPGDRIVSLEKDKPNDDHLRFINDLKIKMFSLGDGEDVDMRLRDVDGNVREIKITPNSGYQKQTMTPTIGVWMANSPIVRGVILDSIAAKAGLEPGDLIHAITVEGERTEIDTDGVGIDIQKIQACNPHKPITLHITRTDKETKVENDHDIHLDVGKGKRVGVELSMGPVVCIQSGSIAELAGLKVGDVITQINGQPIGDPATLPTRLLEYIDQSTVLTVNRGEAEQQVTLKPKAPRTDASVRRRNGPIGLDSIGIGYVIYPTVTGVIAGSSAEVAGIQVGDVLKSAQLIMLPKPIPEEDRLPWLLGSWQKYRQKSLGRKTLAMYELDHPLPIDEENNNWPFILSSIQGETPFEVVLQYERDGVEQTSDQLLPTNSDAMLDSTRGILFASYEEKRVAASWSEAFSLGVREIWEGMKQVVIVLKRIGSNYQNLGGPLTIATAATMEASEGLPRLLIFLTLLSANLAVLNFLPIPVLDGGHMLFLAYEGIMGKPVNERVQMSLTMVGFSMLLCLMLFVFGLDLTRFFG